MNPRIVLAIACAAALLIGLTAWFFVDRRASGTIEVATDAAALATEETIAELSTPASVTTPAGSRTAAPAAILHNAPKSTTADAARSGKGHRLFGIVTTKSDGGPLGSATVTAQLEGETDDQGPKLVTLTTTSNGYYFGSMLPAGDWLLTCGARGHENADRRVTIEADNEVQADFVLVPETGKAHLVVHLRAADGRPLFETLDEPEKEVARALRPVFLATCPLRDTVLGSEIAVLPNRASGVTAPRSDEWFEVKLDMQSNGCCCLALGNRVLDAVPFNASSRDVVLVAAREDLQRFMGSLRCSIVDDASDAALQASIRIRPAAGSARSASSDANGIVQAAQLIEGETQVEVFAMNHASASRTIKIERGIEADLGVIRLKANTSVSGQVRKPPDTPPWHLVYAYRIPETNFVAEEYGIPANVGSDGRFTFESLEPGMYLVGWQNRAPPDLRPVKSGLLGGWTIIDARSRSVSDVQIVITELMWESTTEYLRSHAR